MCDRDRQVVTWHRLPMKVVFGKYYREIKVGGESLPMRSSLECAMAAHAAVDTTGDRSSPRPVGGSTKRARRRGRSSPQGRERRSRSDYSTDSELRLQTTWFNHRKMRLTVPRGVIVARIATVGKGWREGKTLSGGRSRVRDSLRGERGKGAGSGETRLRDGFRSRDCPLFPFRRLTCRNRRSNNCRS